jgi:hypothetical protein
MKKYREIRVDVIKGNEGHYHFLFRHRGFFLDAGVGQERSRPSHMTSQNAVHRVALVPLHRSAGDIHSEQSHDVYPRDQYAQTPKINEMRKCKFRNLRGPILEGPAGKIPPCSTMSMDIIAARDTTHVAGIIRLHSRIVRLLHLNKYFHWVLVRRCGEQKQIWGCDTAITSPYPQISRDWIEVAARRIIEKEQ